MSAEFGMEIWDELERRGPESVAIAGVAVRRGTRVRMHPADLRDILSSTLDARRSTLDARRSTAERASSRASKS
ncbi:MAG: hypothetical protein H0X39_01915 [Actinobacteria bacterium]|nr:hypothetical protein [Actinomycetota bacterium]